MTEFTGKVDKAGDTFSTIVDVTSGAATGAGICAVASAAYVGLAAATVANTIPIVAAIGSGAVAGAIYRAVKHNHDNN